MLGPVVEELRIDCPVLGFFFFSFVYFFYGGTNRQSSPPQFIYHPISLYWFITYRQTVYS